MEEFYDDYIVFVLGTDNFEISKQLRTIAELNGNIDEVYDMCVHIAKKFAVYDNKLNLLTTPSYEILCMFMKEYKQEILDYIFKKKDFEIREEF